MADYREIEDPDELSRLNEALSAELRRKFKTIERRRIGYPAGYFSGEVHFVSLNGDFWWYSGLSDDRTTALNLFGHGTPGDNAMLNIDAQFNVPIAKFSRRTGGSFLQEIRTGNIVLAHRGIATLGHGRIKKSALFSEMIATLREADTSTGTQEFLLISELGSPTLVNDVITFSSELRRSVKSLESKKQKRQPTLSKALNNYFDEFSGTRVVKGRRKMISDCYHGAVVRALRDELEGNNEIYKTREIDLIAFTDKKAFLFEVKTSTYNQSIYTAIGQLIVHAPVVAKHAGRRELERVIVLPDGLAEHLRNTIVVQLGIRILTFTRSAQGLITINGLDQIR
jgi:hypothetical protein